MAFSLACLISAAASRRGGVVVELGNVRYNRFCSSQLYNATRSPVLGGAVSDILAENGCSAESFCRLGLVPLSAEEGNVKVVSDAAIGKFLLADAYGEALRLPMSDGPARNDGDADVDGSLSSIEICCGCICDDGGAFGDTNGGDDGGGVCF